MMIKIKSIYSIFLVLLVMTINVNAASDSYRTGKYEWAFAISLAQSKELTGIGGSSAEISNDAGWGVLVSYNFNEKFNLGINFDFLKPPVSSINTPGLNNNFSAITVNKGLKHRSYELSLTYYFLEKSLTPFVQTGFGNAQLDLIGITASSTFTGCWNDVWFGDTCGGTGVTNAKVNYSLKRTTAGVRWEFKETAHVKLGYSLLTLGSDNTDYDNHGIVRIELGRTY